MRFLLPLLASLAISEVGDGFIGPMMNGGDKPHRRRRRRMLTASDRGDIAFLTATLGKSSAKELAAIRLANI